MEIKAEKTPQGIRNPEGIWIQQAIIMMAEHAAKEPLSPKNIITVTLFTVQTLSQTPDIEMFTINSLSGEKKPFNKDLLLSEGISDLFRAGMIPDPRRNSFHKPYDVGDWIFVNRTHFENLLAGKPIIPEPILSDKMPEYIPPYLKFMLQAVNNLNLSPDNRIMKEDVTEWLDKNWPKDLDGKSPKMIENMATLLRRPEDKKGGNVKF